MSDAVEKDIKAYVDVKVFGLIFYKVMWLRKTFRPMLMLRVTFF